jgi:hypothetical protein
MYILSAAGVLHQFTITEGAWKVSAGFVNKNSSFVMTAQDSAMGCFFIDNTGTIMIAVGNTAPCTVFRYTLTTPWDTSTATPVLGVGGVPITKYIGNIITSSYSVQVSPDGLNLFILQGQIIYKYVMSVPWDLTTAVYTTGDTYTIPTGVDTSPQCIRFRADGLMMYVMGYTNNTIYQYQLTTPWDIKSSMTYASKAKSMASAGTLTHKFAISPDGRNLIAHTLTGSILSSWYFGTAWDIQTLVYRSSVTLGAPNDIIVSPDGATLYPLYSTILRQYTIFDISPSINWPSNIVWQGGMAPDLPDKKQSMQVDLYSTDGGVTYFAHTKMARLFSPTDLY